MISVALGDATADTTGGASWASASFNVLAGEILIILQYVVRNVATTSPTLSKTAGTATIGAFTEGVDDVTQTDTNFYRVKSSWCLVTGSGTCTITESSTSATGYGLVILRVTGADTLSPIGQHTNAQAIGSVPTFTVSGSKVGSLMVEADSVARNPATWTPDSSGGWVEQFDSGHGTPAHGVYCSTHVGGQNTYTASAGTTATWRGVYLEIKAANSPPFGTWRRRTSGLLVR